MGNWNEDDPEVQSVDALAEFLFDNDQDTFTAEELQLVCQNANVPTYMARKALEDYGLQLGGRLVEKRVRGFTAWDNNRFAGNPCGGGSGHEQISGFAGREG